MVQIPFGPDYPLALVDAPDAVSANATTISAAATSSAAAGVFSSLTSNSSDLITGQTGASGYSYSVSGSSASAADLESHRPIQLEVLPSAYVIKDYV